MECMDVLLSYTDSAEDPEEIFTLLDILGRGAYGSVSKALHKQSGKLYAVKILPATSVNEISSIKKQIAILRECNDEHIVKYYGSYFKDNNLWIVMEYCMAGSITDIVNITQKELNEQEIASILQEVLKGLMYLHQNKKIHRDIKGANILLDQNGTAKLADFGVSTEMTYTNARHNTHIGSPYWMSPQVIKYSAYNQKTDIWSLGITAIELAQGIVPYSHLKPFMAMWTMRDKPVQSFKEPQKWSVQFQEFVKQCLHINPQLRSQAEQLLKHEFIERHSKGKKVLLELVQNSIQEIQKYRAQQKEQNEEEQQDYDNSESFKNELKGLNNSQLTDQPVIRKTHSFISVSSQKKPGPGSNLKSFKGSGSVDEEDSRPRRSQMESSNKKSGKSKDCYKNSNGINEDCDSEYGSVIFKDQENNEENNGHSRQCSMVSVSSTIVKNDEQIGQPQNNYLSSYVQNMQSMQEQQQKIQQTIQLKVKDLQTDCIRAMQQVYSSTKQKIQQLISEADKFSANGSANKPSNSNNFIKDELTKQLEGKGQSSIKSPICISKNILDFLLNHSTDQDIKKYKQSIPEDYISELESEWKERQIKKQKNVMISLIDQMENVGVTEQGNYEEEDQDRQQIGTRYRKKSQSSACPDSPESASLMRLAKKGAKNKLTTSAKFPQANRHRYCDDRQPDYADEDEDDFDYEENLRQIENSVNNSGSDDDPGRLNYYQGGQSLASSNPASSIFHKSQHSYKSKPKAFPANGIIDTPLSSSTKMPMSQFASNSSAHPNSTKAITEKEKNSFSNTHQQHQLNKRTPCSNKYKQIFIHSDKFPNLSAGTLLDNPNQNQNPNGKSLIMMSTQGPVSRSVPSCNDSTANHASGYRPLHSQPQLPNRQHQTAHIFNKRVLTAESHDQYEDDSVSTQTKAHRNNFRQFIDDPIVMNNLKKQLTQPNEDLGGSGSSLVLTTGGGGTSINCSGGGYSQGISYGSGQGFFSNSQSTGPSPFNAKVAKATTATSFGKELKSAKSKDSSHHHKDKPWPIRDKERATHIAHNAMAKDRTVTTTNSNKKLRAVKLEDTSPYVEKDSKELSSSANNPKNNRSKKVKSKNKQTASTTIPFDSGNVAIYDVLPSRIGKSKDTKKQTQISKTGPFSKIKNRN